MSLKPQMLLPLLLLLIILYAPTLPRAAAYLPGNLLISQTWGTSGLEYGNAVALDASGNIYIAGSMTNSTIIGVPPHDAALLLKYDSGGNLQWARSWGGLTYDEAYALALDPSGNVYLTGATRSFSSGGTCQYDVYFLPCPDAFLLKYNSTGNLLMQRTWGGNNSDVATGITLDSTGNIYLTGSTQSLDFCQQYSRAFLLKINSTGSLLWQQYSGHTDVNCSLGNRVSANGITIDNSTGSLYVIGSLNGIGLELTKYNSTGSQIWQHELASTSSSQFPNGLCAYPDRINIDPSTHDILVAAEGGNCSMNLNDIHLIALRADSSGNLLWAKSWSSGLAYGYGVAVGPTGHVFVSGGQQTYGKGKLGVVLLELSSSGSLLSHIIWGPTQGDIGHSVAVDASGNAVVTGQLSGGPPYGQGVGSYTLTTLSASLSTRTLGLGTTSLPLLTPPGTTSVPIGSQTYAGGTDVFLIKYRPPVPTEIPCGGITCGVSSDSTISGFSYLTNHTIDFTIGGTAGSDGFADAIIPRSLAGNQNGTNIQVYLNGTRLDSASFTIGQNSTDFFVHIPFTFHSIYNVTIFFPVSSLGISSALPLLSLLMLVPWILRSKRRSVN